MPLLAPHAYYLWVEDGRPESDGVDYWETSVRCHRWRLPYSNGYRPTAEEIMDWNMQSAMALSGYHQHVCIEARCKREGIPCLCPACNGHGSYWEPVESEKLCDEWEHTEPPAGEGYQCWETVSEGSPISPVFATPEELATYMANHPWGAMDDCSYEDWMTFINGPGWAPSMIISNGEMKSGVKAMVELTEENE